MPREFSHMRLPHESKLQAPVIDFQCLSRSAINFARRSHEGLSPTIQRPHGSVARPREVNRVNRRPSSTV